MPIRLLKTVQNLQAKTGNEKTLQNIKNPPIDYKYLLETYEFSSIISGIIEKISAKGNIAFENTENKILDNFLNSLDLEFIFSNLLTFGVVFFERLENAKGEKTLKLKEILTYKMYLASDDSEYDFIYNPDGLEEIGFHKEDILFFKGKSISNLDYGDSIFSKAIDEVILLSYITKFYKNGFARGNIDPNILYDETGSLTDEQIDKIENMINDRISGIENSHTTVVVPTKLGKIDLTSKIDPDKYIALKRELKEDIAIATNIPFDLLSPQNSNRATSQTALKVLYNDIIIPLQNKIVKQLQTQLLQWKEFGNCADLEKISEEDIKRIQFKNVNLTDPKDEMLVLTGYQKQGVLSINEIREKLGKKPISGGDDHIILQGQKENLVDKQVEDEFREIAENYK